MVSANGLMDLLYTDYTSSDILAWEDVWRAAKAYGFNPMVEDGMVSRSTLMAELNNGKPSIFWMDNSYHDHAVVLRGYFLQGQTWAIWNPWYVTGNENPVYEQYTMGGTYLPMGKSTSEWVFSEKCVAHNF